MHLPHLRHHVRGEGSFATLWKLLCEIFANSLFIPALWWRLESWSLLRSTLATIPNSPGWPRPTLLSSLRNVIHRYEKTQLEVWPHCTGKVSKIQRILATRSLWSQIFFLKLGVDDSLNLATVHWPAYLFYPTEPPVSATSAPQKRQCSLHPLYSTFTYSISTRPPPRWCGPAPLL